MNKITKEEFKKHFENNLLDGDDVYDCGKTMLLAEDVYEYITDLLFQNIN